MGKVRDLVLLLVLLHLRAHGQETDWVQNPAVGIHFLFNDFKTPVYLKTASLGEVIKHRQFGKIKDMETGLALSYMQGLNKHFDFTCTLAGSFTDYPSQDGHFSGTDYL